MQSSREHAVTLKGRRQGHTFFGTLLENILFCTRKTLPYKTLKNPCASTRKKPSLYHIRNLVVWLCGWVFGLVRFGLVRFGSVWFGLVWFGVCACWAGWLDVCCCVVLCCCRCWLWVVVCCWCCVVLCCVVVVLLLWVVWVVGCCVVVCDCVWVLCCCCVVVCVLCPPFLVTLALDNPAPDHQSGRGFTKCPESPHVCREDIFNDENAQRETKQNKKRGRERKKRENLEDRLHPGRPPTRTAPTRTFLLPPLVGCTFCPFGLFWKIRE